jgi:hypothetical protein
VLGGTPPGCHLQRRRCRKQAFAVRVKGAGSQRDERPARELDPPGSNRSGGGGNKAVGASGVEGRIRRLGESVGRNLSER